MTLRKTPQQNRAAALSIAARFAGRLRIPRVAVTAHPVLTGNRNYLRALRAAEMAAWEAGLPLKLAASFAETIAETESK
jgi:hypothetical protein